MIAVGHSMFRIDGDPTEHFVEWYINTDPIVIEIRFNGANHDTADLVMRTHLEGLINAMSDRHSEPVPALPGA